MIRGRLSDEEWAFFAPFVIEAGPLRGRPPLDHRRVLDAIFWITRTGAPWRDLPEELGNWNSVHRQFRRWTAAGLWDLMLQGFTEGGGEDALQMIDSTVRNTVPYRTCVLVRIPADANPGRKTVIDLTLKEGETESSLGRIEVLTAGQQTVIAGLHSSGNAITWYRPPANPALKHTAPQVKVGMLQLPSFPDLVHHVLEAARSIGENVIVGEPEAHGAKAERAKSITELAAPSVDDLVAVLNAMPNPPDLPRDPWTHIGFATAAAIKGLDAKNPDLVTAEDIDR